MSEVGKYAEEIEGGSCVVDFGAKADAICANAAASLAAKGESSQVSKTFLFFAPIRD